MARKKVQSLSNWVDDFGKVTKEMREWKDDQNKIQEMLNFLKGKLCKSSVKRLGEEKRILLYNYIVKAQFQNFAVSIPSALMDEIRNEPKMEKSRRLWTSTFYLEGLLPDRQKVISLEMQRMRLVGRMKLKKASMGLITGQKKSFDKKLAEQLAELDKQIEKAREGNLNTDLAELRAGVVKQGHMLDCEIAGTKSIVEACKIVREKAQKEREEERTRRKKLLAASEKATTGLILALLKQR